MTGEPLIEGMLVGTEKDILTTSETHQVGCFGLILVTKLTDDSSMLISTCTRQSISIAGFLLVSIPLSCRIIPGSDINPGLGSSLMRMLDIRAFGTCWVMLPSLSQLRLFPEKRISRIKSGLITCRGMLVTSSIRSSVSVLFAVIVNRVLTTSQMMSSL